MLTDLERDLRDAFAREADAVDLPGPEWSGPRSVTTPRRRWLVGAAAAAVAALGVGALWVRQSPADPAPARQPSTTVPAGVEVPLRPILFDDLRWAPEPFVVGPVRPGTFHAFEVDGVQFVVWETVEHVGGPSVAPVRCIEDELGGTSCRVMSDHPMLIDLGTVWVWPDLPERAAFVTARTELGSRWQRPVDSLAAFTSSGTLSAVDDQGVEVARLDQAETLLDLVDPRANGVVFDSLDRDGESEVAAAAIASALRCLGEQGVESDPREPVRVELPLDDIWAECVAVAGSAAAERFAELGGLMVTSPADDPSVEEEWWPIDGDDVEVTCVLQPGGVETCRYDVGPMRLVAPVVVN